MSKDTDTNTPNNNPCLEKHDLKRVKTALQKFYEKHGKPPTRSGEATPYVGHKTTWADVNAWLRNNGHGTLSQLCREMGLGPQLPQHSFEAIKDGIRKYHEENGKIPVLVMPTGSGKGTVLEKLQELSGEADILVSTTPVKDSEES